MSRLSIRNLTVSYPLFDSTSRSLKAALFSAFDKGSRGTVTYFRAVDQLSFEVEPGDRVCLIGLNGAGKTTLLRTMAGIFPPSEGEILIEGRVTPLLDFATGFEMEMSGRENIIARGLFLGMSIDDMLEREPEIVEFSGLGDFIDQPVKIYSSGMFLRLAFAIVTSIEPDVLLVDEIVGAGDQSFAKKAERRMLDMLDKGQIVVMATHSTNLALQLCNKALWLQSGRLVNFGPTREVIEAYAASYPG